MSIMEKLDKAVETIFWSSNITQTDVAKKPLGTFKDNMSNRESLFIAGSAGRN